MELSQYQISIITITTTVVLAIITGYYAIITHFMMKNQKDLSNLELRPFLAMDSIFANLYKEDEKSKIAGVQLGIRLKNVSRVLLKYKMFIKKVVINNETAQNPILLNDGGYVYPNQPTEFTYDVINNVDLSNDVIIGEIEFEIEYFSIENKKYKSVRHYKVFIYTKSNTVQWKSIFENEIEL